MEDRKIEWFYRILILLLFGIIFVLIYQLGNPPSYVNKNYNGTESIPLTFTGNFTTSEKNYYKETIVGKLKPLYTTFIQELIVYNNLDELQKICSDSAIACNEQKWGKSVISVYTRGKEIEDKNVLCHEVLHSVFNSEKEQEHAIVYDLESKLVCYTNSPE
ncbi:MAG: hypothetical protein WC758_08520, partial [Candidatus Woesearchaeota archaeon]